MIEVASLHIKAQAGDIVKAEKDLDGFSQSAGRAGKSADDLGSRATMLGGKLAKLAGIAGAVAGSLLAAFSFTRAVRETAELETRLARMNAVIRATGGAAGRTAEQLHQSARQLARDTLESTEGVMRAQQTLLTFRKVQGDVFDRTIQAAADMSAALGGDLNGATLQLGKALENPITGLSALSRSGTVFTEQQKAMVKAMVETGKIAQAQAFILDELDAQYGKARSAASAYDAAVDSLGQSVSEIGIAFIQKTGALAALTAAVAVLDRSLQFLTENMDSVVGIIISASTAMVIRMAPAIWGLVSATYAWVAALVTLKGAIIATGIGALIVGAGLLIGLFLQLVSAAGGFGEALTLIANVGREAIDRLGLGFEGLGRLVASVAAGLRATFASAFAFILQKFADLTQKVADGINNMFSAVGLDLGLTGIGSGAAADIAAYAAEEQDVANRQAAAAQTFFNAMTAPMESIKALRDAVKGAKDEVASIPPVAVAAGDALQNMGAAGGNAAKAAEDGVKTLKDHVSDFKTTLSGAFTGLVTGAMSLRDALGNVIGKLAEMAAMKAFETLWGGGLGRGVTSLLGGLFGFSHGGVFNAGKVTPFATGGVVSRPTMFPMSGGAGLMGEAGPEAIMPLRRGSDGKLGVAATSEGGARSLSVSIGFDATVGELRAWVRDEAGNVVAQARPAMIRQSVAATNRAMASTKAFGSP